MLRWWRRVTRTQGYKSREITRKLFISEQTVKNHLGNIFHKLGVSDRLELALCALHQGLVPERRRG